MTFLEGNEYFRYFFMKSDMRGGPRLMCSPYLTGSLGVMLVLVSFNYWSVSTQNYDLLIRIQQMQKQLELGSENVIELEKSKSGLVGDLRTKDSDIAQCRKLKKECDSQTSDLRSKRQRAEERLIEATEKIKTLTDEKKTLADEKEDLEIDVLKLTEEKDALKIQLDSLTEEMSKKDIRTGQLAKELEEVRAQVNIDKADLDSQKLRVANMSSMVSKNTSSPKLGKGQLPDIDPDDVKVIRKETHGSGFHLVPKDNTSAEVKNVGGSQEGERFDEPSHDEGKNKANVPSGISSTKKPSSKPTILEAKQVMAPDIDEHVDKLNKDLEKNDDKDEKVDSEVDGKPESEPDLGDDPDQGSPVGYGGGKDLDQGSVGGGRNLDHAEADNQRPLYENGPDGRNDLVDDDQDPDGDVNEHNQESVEKGLEDLADSLRKGEEEEEKADEYSLQEPQANKKRTE